MEELTQMELLLLYGMKKAGVPEEDAISTMAALETEEDQTRLLHFMMDCPEATPQDIMRELVAILDIRDSK